MKPILQLRYLILPTLFTWFLVFVTALCILYAILKDWLVSVAWSAVIALVGGAPLGLFGVTPFVASLARGEFIGLRARSYASEIENFTMQAKTADGNQMDYFRGLTPDQWHDSAVRIAAAIKSGNKKFTFAIVGQTQRPKMVPILLAAEYIIPVGEGEYEHTDKGIDFWLSLAALPYPWEHAPQRLRNLG